MKRAMQIALETPPRKGNQTPPGTELYKPLGLTIVFVSATD